MRNHPTHSMNGHTKQTAAARPLIEIDDSMGTIRVSDSRLITRGRRAFCRRLVEALARRPGVSKAVVDLASASCRVEFSPRSVNSHIMAGVFADSVGEASTSSLHRDGTPWWQPSTNWVTLTAYPLAGDVSLWETIEVKPGQVCIRHQGLSGNYERLSKVADAIAGLDRVEACQAVPWSHRLAIDFRPENGVSDWFLDQAERSFEDVLAAESRQASASALLMKSRAGGSLTQVAGGPARWLYLALGGGALVMTVVGLIMPGIPTVPFLLLSSYGFARSSPRMNRRLRETKFFGPILIEWEQHGGLSDASKKKLIGLTGVIILFAVILAPLSPLGLVLILVFSSLSIYGLSQLPSIPDEASYETPSRQSPRLALPAP
jgi:uncharacterized membrane protein YbaN (DUF454 family)